LVTVKERIVLFVLGAKNCSVSELNSCGAGGICVQATVGHDFGVCECDHRLNRTYQSGPCIVVPTPSSSHDFSNTTTGTFFLTKILGQTGLLSIDGKLIHSW